MQCNYLAILSNVQWLQELLNGSASLREYYYSSSANLKVAMILLGSDPSVTIRFKALDLVKVKCRVNTSECIIRESVNRTDG